MVPGADGNIHFCHPDGEAVLNDIFAFGNRLQRHFMTGRDILANHKGLTANRDDAAFCNGVNGYGDIIMKMDLEYVHLLLLCQFSNVSLDADFSHTIQMGLDSIGKTIDS